MKRGSESIFIFGVIIIFLFAFASASFDLGVRDYQIGTSYPQGGNINGWINISFMDEPANSIISDSFGNMIQLSKLLSLNTNLDYDCFPSDCESNYLTEGAGEPTKVISLGSGKNKLVGFKISGNNFQDFLDFSINISSDAPISETPQLQIDILNDGEIEWNPYKDSGVFSEPILGCYEEENVMEVAIYGQKYCQNITIGKTPNVNLGAFVIKDSGENASFQFEICGSENNCGLCEASTNTSGAISCTADYTISDEETFTICLNAKGPGDANKYKINSENQSTCGYAVSVENGRDFEIFATTSQFAQIKEFSLDINELQNAGVYLDLNFYLEQYLERYDDCSTGDCIIPINFISGINSTQSIILSGANLGYISEGILKEENIIYEFQEIPAKINSGFQEIRLDNANFLVSGDVGESVDYSINLEGKELLSEKIAIKEVPKIFSINTKSVIGGYPTEFFVRLDKSPNSIFSSLQYTWDFGDGNQEVISSTNKTTYTYSSLGNFTLIVSILSGGELQDSKSFSMVVGTPKDSVDSLLIKKSNDLSKIKLNLESFTTFQKNSLTERLNIETLEEGLSSISTRKDAAITEEDYIPIMTDLVELEVPEDVLKTKIVDDFQAYSTKENINLNALATITGEDFEKELENSYVDAVIIWNLENLDFKIDNEEFSLVYEENSPEFVLSFFKLNIEQNPNVEGTYLIVPKFDGIALAPGQSMSETPSHYYVQLSSSGGNFEFVASEKVNLEESGIFVSPRISQLEVLEPKFVDSFEQISKVSIAILVIILVLILGFIFYIILQEWYKKKYESYLFKNKNDLYNIVSYVHAEKNKGAEPEVISKKLKKAGWNSEQVKYVMRKYAGKRTGLVEVPVEKIFSFLNKKNDESKDDKSSFTKP